MAWWLLAASIGAPIFQVPAEPELPQMIQREGSGEMLKIGDRVTLHFAAETPNGKWLASSWKRGFPYSFAIGDATGDRLLQRCVLQMLEGEESKFFCPASLAYGDLNMPPILGSGTDLVLTIRVVSVVRTDAANLPDISRRRA